MEQELEKIAQRVDRVIEHADKAPAEKLVELTEKLRKLNELLAK